MTRVTLVLLGAVLITCTKSAPPEPPHTKRQTDLRSTLIVIYPEYRGTRVSRGEARLTRIVKGPAEDAAAIATETLKANQFVKDGAAWVRAPHQVFIDGTQWVVTVPLNQPTVEKLYMAPTAMSTGDLTMWFPRGAKAPATVREQFDLTLEYLAQPEGRSVFLTRQLIRLLLGNSQWQASLLPVDWDNDAGTSDGPFDARLEEQSTHASLEIHRLGPSVSLHFTLVTDE